MSKLYIWKVSYQTIFESSSGNDRFITYDQCAGIVITSEGTLDAVKSAIASSLDSQTRLNVLNEACFMGQSVNELPATMSATDQSERLNSENDTSKAL